MDSEHELSGYAYRRWAEAIFWAELVVGEPNDDLDLQATDLLAALTFFSDTYGQPGYSGSWVMAHLADSREAYERMGCRLLFARHGESSRILIRSAATSEGHRRQVQQRGLARFTATQL